MPIEWMNSIAEEPDAQNTRRSFLVDIKSSVFAYPTNPIGCIVFMEVSPALDNLTREP
jgi:hypothetical protein